MKITVELDDFRDEEYGSIKEYIEYQINEAIEKNIGVNISNSIQIKINERVKKIIDEKSGTAIDEQINKFGMQLLSDYMEKEISVTNDYGEEKFKGTIKENLHKMFDKFFKERVDSHGKASNYNNKYTRVEYLSSEILNEKFSAFAKQTIKDTKAAIEEKLTTELKTAVGKSFVEQMGIPKLLESIKKATET